MWHEARKQERRIRGLIVDYRRRAERRQDFYEKIQADPTQFIQIHGRRCKIHLDPAVAAAGDGAAIIVPWQGQRDNLIDRFDVRAHLDCIPPVSKTNDESEISQEERQCNYERYRILAQNDFLNLTEEKFLHQLFLEEQFGANAPLDAGQSNQGRKKTQKSGAAIGYSYDDAANSGSVGGVIDTQQPFAHLKHASVGATSSKKPENESESESDSDIDMDVSIEVSKLDTSQAHELNACGRNYGMLSNDFYSYLTKDADEADAMRVAREEEREKMLLSGRKSRRERKAQKERRLARHTFSPPSYAAKEDKMGKDEESESRSPSPSDTTEKITYITSFGGEDELQPHSKISITLGKGSSTLGAACVDASTSASQATYAQKVKDNLDKLKKSNESSATKGNLRSRSNSRSRSRSRSRRRSYRLARRSRSRSQSYKRRRRSDRRSRSRSRSLSKSRRHYSRRYRSPYKRSRTGSRSKSRSRRRRYTSSSSSRSSRSVSPRRSSRRIRQSPKYNKPANNSSRSSSVMERIRSSPIKEISPKLQKIEKPIDSSIEALTTVSPPPLPPSIHTEEESSKITPPVVTVIEPPPPLKRYYGRKRGEYSSSSESGSETDNDFKTAKTAEPMDIQETGDMDTTSEKSNPLPSTSSSYKGKLQTSKYGSNTSVSNAPETKVSKNQQIITMPDTKINGDHNLRSEINESKSTTVPSSSASGSGAGGSVRLNLRERLKKKMQNLLNKQYKADKKAEIEKSERERQLQQERYEEMRELAIKLRRRQREIRHRYGTPNSKASESEASEYAPTTNRENRSKSHSSERSNSRISSATYNRDSKRKSPLLPTKRSRSREGRRSTSRSSRHPPYRSRSQSRNRRSSSRRRRRSISRSKRYPEASQEHSSSRYASDRSRHDERYRRSRSRNERDRERNRDRERDREREKQRQDRLRSVKEGNDGRMRSDRYRDHRYRDRGDRTHQQQSVTSATSSSTSTSRSRVVISAPPKLKKLVDY